MIKRSFTWDRRGTPNKTMIHIYIYVYFPNGTSYPWSFRSGTKQCRDQSSKEGSFPGTLSWRAFNQYSPSPHITCFKNFSRVDCFFHESQKKPPVAFLYFSFCIRGPEFEDSTKLRAFPSDQREVPQPNWDSPHSFFEIHFLILRFMDPR